VCALLCLSVTASLPVSHLSPLSHIDEKTGSGVVRQCVTSTNGEQGYVRVPCVFACVSAYISVCLCVHKCCKKFLFFSVLPTRLLKFFIHTHTLLLHFVFISAVTLTTQVLRSMVVLSDRHTVCLRLAKLFPTSDVIVLFS